jgi:hypothetical protein
VGIEKTRPGRKKTLEHFVQEFGHVGMKAEILALLQKALGSLGT